MLAFVNVMPTPAFAKCIYNVLFDDGSLAPVYCDEANTHIAYLPTHIAARAFLNDPEIHQDLALAREGYERDMLADSMPSTTLHNSFTVTQFRAAVAERRARNATTAKVEKPSPVNLILMGDVITPRPSDNVVVVTPAQLFTLRDAFGRLLNTTRLTTPEREQWVRNVKKTAQANVFDTTPYVLVNANVLTTIATKITENTEYGLSVSDVARILAWLYFKSDVLAVPDAVPLPEVSKYADLAVSLGIINNTERVTLNSEVIAASILTSIQSRTPVHNLRLPKNASIRTFCDARTVLHSLVPVFSQASKAAACVDPYDVVVPGPVTTLSL
jgi:hypothetical protein